MASCARTARHAAARRHPLTLALTRRQSRPRATRRQSRPARPLHLLSHRRLWPWSGHYEVTDTIWTSAHHTQFMSPGWRLLQGGSSGMLPGGGSYVAAVSPSKADFTLVLETMQGNCLRCSGGKTQAQTLTFALTNGLPGPGAVLKQWQTVQGASFVAQPDVTVAADGTITVSVPADGMVTVSTITTASHGTPRPV